MAPSGPGSNFAHGAKSLPLDLLSGGRAWLASAPRGMRMRRAGWVPAVPADGRTVRTAVGPAGITDVRSRVSDVARIRPLDLIGEQAIPVAAEF